MDPLPVLTSFSDEERRICDLQDGFATRLKQSAYYVVERTKTDGSSQMKCVHLMLNFFAKNFQDTPTSTDHPPRPNQPSKKAIYISRSSLPKYSRIISTQKERRKVRATNSIRISTQADMPSC